MQWRGVGVGWGGGGAVTRSPVDDIRGSKGANVAANSLDQLLLQLRAVLCVLHEGHIRVNALPLHWVLIPASSPHVHRLAILLKRDTLPRLILDTT